MNYSVAYIRRSRILHIFRLVKSELNGSEILSEYSICNRETKLSIIAVYNNSHYPKERALTMLGYFPAEVCQDCITALKFSTVHQRISSRKFVIRTIDSNY